MFPKGTTKVYSGFTPRSNKYAPKGCEEVVVFGTQMMVKQLHEHFAENFFKTKKRISQNLNQLKEEVIGEIRYELSLYLGQPYDTSDFEKLWNLGYLPIEIKSLEEGTLCPIKVPMLTIYNTHPDFYWLTNYLETIISNLLWKPLTSASIASTYKKLLKKWALKTDKENIGFVDFQGHDFSMRGLDSVDATISSGLGHATSFLGSDSLPVIHGARKYYNEKGFVICSVPASEHSVMCSGSKDGEKETVSRLMKTFDKGILSLVMDTWDITKVVKPLVDGTLVQLKEEILNRDGKLVIRPDSGDPVEIICGHNKELTSRDLEAYYPQFYNKGLIECLWDIFGGTINEQGYKVLDSHIGAIYGDSINLERAEQICTQLEAKGFASTNIVLGIGSFTYQYNTRDTFGFAMKATYVEIDGVGQNIFKDPITDDGMKKSATGLMKVGKKDGKLYLQDNCTWEEEQTGFLKVIYKDGLVYNDITLTEIRERLNG